MAHALDSAHSPAPESCVVFTCSYDNRQCAESTASDRILKFSEVVYHWPPPLFCSPPRSGNHWLPISNSLLPVSDGESRGEAG